MKYIITFALFFGIISAFCQTTKTADSTKKLLNNRDGEYLFENEKIGDFKFSNYLQSRNSTIGVYYNKSKYLLEQKTLYGINIKGRVVHPAGLSSTEEDVSVMIWSDEVEKAITALQYIKDTLLPNRPKDQIDFYVNFEHSYLKISAWYDGYDKQAEWDVRLWFDRYLTNGYDACLKPKDVADLLAALKTARDKIKAANSGTLPKHFDKAER